jgi:hypothetical protein
MNFVKIGNQFINLDEVKNVVVVEGRVRLIYGNDHFTNLNENEGRAIWGYLENISDCIEVDVEKTGPRSTQTAGGKAINPNMAKTMAQLVTPRQLIAIRAICNSQKLDADSECKELMQCKPEELSRKTASAFIDHLNAKDKERLSETRTA